VRRPSTRTSRSCVDQPSAVRVGVRNVALHHIAGMGEFPWTLAGANAAGSC
jgi:hypothetical protein